MKKKKRQIYGGLLVFGILIVILYLMFHDSYRSIWEQLKNANKYYLCLLILIGNLYIVLDGLVYRAMIRRNGYDCKVSTGTCAAYMGVFLNVTTLGAGTKAGQIYYLYQKGVEPGNGFGMLVMEYVFHKATIMLYACVMLLVNYRYITVRYADSVRYLYTGFLLSGIIVLCLVAICLSDRIHRLVMAPLHKWVKKEKWIEKLDELEQQLRDVRQVGKRIYKDKAGIFWQFALNSIKMTCWYILPMLAYMAIESEPFPMSPMACIATTAIMQLMIGVIPSTGGMGSTELVFMLLFGKIFGKVTAGAAMILYRISNFYVPFLVSIPVVMAAQRGQKQKK